MTHYWHWRKWLPQRRGEPCRVVAVGRMNAVLVEFQDGSRVVTSRYAVRTVRKHGSQASLFPGQEGNTVEDG